ncbi:MAG: RNA polymerase sigma factor FliA [Halothiobacillaceae bacterium]|nr:MAG: RNA polymerase sigma factor FliA [Halothiobacillaceae bacterium]
MNARAMYTQIQHGDPGELVRQHAGLVKRIAFHLSARLPRTVLVEDLIQAGMMGLLEAARGYQDGHGASFETFAGIRIRGAMLDEVRRHDWTPRSVHRRSRAVNGAIRGLEARLGREPRDQEVIEVLGIGLDEYHQILTDSAGASIFSLDHGGEDAEDLTIDVEDERPNPEAAFMDESFRAELAQAMADLPERERMVMSLYYVEEMNLREIGAILGVSESRVSQIHGKAMIRLREHLADWRGGI